MIKVVLNNSQLSWQEWTYAGVYRNCTWCLSQLHLKALQWEIRLHCIKAAQKKSIWNLWITYKGLWKWHLHCCAVSCFYKAFSFHGWAFFQLENSKPWSPSLFYSMKRALFTCVFFLWEPWVYMMLSCIDWAFLPPGKKRKFPENVLKSVGIKQQQKNNANLCFLQSYIFGPS